MRRTLLATRSTHLHNHSRKRPLHVYTQGEGFLGCLGHGDFSRQADTLPVAALASKDVRYVSAGWTHSAAVCHDGEVLVWGRPFDMRQPLRINRIQGMFPFVVNVINALSSKKELLSRPVTVSLRGDPQPKLPPVFEDARPSPPANASHTHHQRGNAGPVDAGGGADARSRPETSDVDVVSTAVVPSPLRAKSVACSAGLTVILDENGRVYCMGYNRWGQCAQGPDNVLAIFEPLRVGGDALQDERVTSLAVGFQQVLVLCESGRVYGWGKSLRGQLGIGCEMIELPVPGVFCSRATRSFVMFCVVRVAVLHEFVWYSGGYRSCVIMACVCVSAFWYEQ